MTYEIYVGPDGGLVTASNGSLSWIEDSEKEIYGSKSEFQNRLNELQTDQ